MAKVKITVLKRMVNQDLVNEFCEADVTTPCPHFTDGQVFTVEGIAQPESFCGAAWHDILQTQAFQFPDTGLLDYNRG